MDSNNKPDDLELDHIDGNFPDKKKRKRRRSRAGRKRSAATGFEASTPTARPSTTRTSRTARSFRKPATPTTTTRSVDVAGVAASFLSVSIPPLVGVDSAPTARAVGVVENFLRYVLQHDVYPEHDAAGWSLADDAPPSGAKALELELFTCSLALRPVEMPDDAVVGYFRRLALGPTVVEDGWMRQELAPGEQAPLPADEDVVLLWEAELLVAMTVGMMVTGQVCDLTQNNYYACLAGDSWSAYKCCGATQYLSGSTGNCVDKS
ncbi:Argonaute complex, subunit Arb1 [Cordyceps fumosorosea ARSEF 2679]|uniref:Argonaute complex, subunit Arb1 n=1 Tax=Cordyceps fumosorosea (strain ARSEF 2679) TaxID=1081104 RepID=A0A168ATA1_CORFA|nr:Argonaute complex, subunit Arb1 [Cordyceps fumosorosea ARSEF 2679]OAA69165.1 Argonaute complex, subunit Arb1 [Cordyceps fumosorosea ARSEF 2679]